jgi:hypothetical protein
MEDHSHKKLDNGPPRQFSAEELAPQIMIRKAKKVNNSFKISVLVSTFSNLYQERFYYAE